MKKNINYWRHDDYMSASYYDNKILLIYSLLNNDNKKMQWQRLSHNSKHDIFNIADEKLKSNFNSILNYHTNFA